MNKNIEGKVVITGASSGLGEATARLLSAEGASVALGEWRGGDALWIRYDVVRSSNQYRPGPFTNRH